MTSILKVITIAILVGSLQLMAATYRIKVSLPNGGPKLGSETILQFQLFRGTDPTPLTANDLQVEHEKLIHLMSIDSGFTEYHHEHPVEVSSGLWQVPILIKTAGDYKFFVQMLPQDEILTKTVNFDAKFVSSPQQIVPLSPVHPEANLVFTDGEYEVKLNSTAELLQKKIGEIYFRIKKNGIQIPIEELDNYLGAKMHIAAISADKTDFVHAHPGGHFDSEPSAAEIVKTYFKQSGYYGIFMQFSHKGVLHTTQFAVLVKALR